MLGLWQRGNLSGGSSRHELGSNREELPPQPAIKGQRTLFLSQTNSERALERSASLSQNQGKPHVKQLKPNSKCPHDFNSTTLEAEVSSSVILRPDWSICIGRSRPVSKTLS